MMRYLINYGADMHKLNNNEFSPFHRAADRNLIDCWLFLLKAGCDLSQEPWIAVRISSPPSVDPGV